MKDTGTAYNVTSNENILHTTHQPAVDPESPVC